MFYELGPDVMPHVQGWVDNYLDHWTFFRLELLLRACNTEESVGDEPCRELKELAEDYMLKEEARLHSNLENFRYELDDIRTLRLVLGPGRVERVRTSYSCFHSLTTCSVVSVTSHLPHVEEAGRRLTSSRNSYSRCRRI